MSKVSKQHLKTTVNSLLGRYVAAALPDEASAHAQNYVNNGNLPGILLLKVFD